MTKETVTTPTEDKATLDRRAFLRGVGAGAGAVGAVATVAVTGGTAAAAEVGATPADADGYRETAHVRRYYDLARF